MEDLAFQESNTHTFSGNHEIKPGNTVNLGSVGAPGIQSAEFENNPIVTNKGGVLVVQVVELEYPDQDPKFRSETVSAFKKRR